MPEARMPRTLALELSSACVFACEYCDRVNWLNAGHLRSRAHMDYGVFVRLIDEIAGCEDHISLTINYEGESLLHPRVADMLGYCRQRGVAPWLSTRLHAASDALLEMLVSTCSTVAVSLDLPGSSRNATLSASNAGQYPDQNANIERLLQHRTAGSAAIVVTTVLERGDSVEAQRVQAFVGRWLDRVSTIYLYQGIDFRCDGIGYMNDQGISEHLKRRRPCAQPFDYLAVLSDGRLSPCCNTSRLVLRESVAEQSLVDAVGSQELAVLRERHASLDLSDTLCANCDLWIEGWLGDETVTIALPDGRNVQGLVEGGGIRIDCTLDEKP